MMTDGVSSQKRCCQPETPVCDLTVWCDFIGARHASITRECSRAEREGPDTSDAAVSNTSERLLTMVTTFCEGLSREQMRLHFFLNSHKRTHADALEGPRRNQGRAQGALDGHSEQHEEEQR